MLITRSENYNSNSLNTKIVEIFMLLDKDIIVSSSEREKLGEIYNNNNNNFLYLDTNESCFKNYIESLVEAKLFVEFIENVDKNLGVLIIVSVEKNLPYEENKIKDAVKDVGRIINKNNNDYIETISNV